MTQHDPRFRVQHMLDNAREAVDLLGDRSLEALHADRVLQLALVTLVQVIGEASSRVPKDLREAHPEVEWGKAIGMRHRLVHGYDMIDFDIVYDTVRDNLTELIKQLERMLESI
jgi:uncharacterized protein with HEPN domain